jgi:hypothetical protein
MFYSVAILPVCAVTSFAVLGMKPNKTNIAAMENTNAPANILLLCIDFLFIRSSLEVRQSALFIRAIHKIS